MKTTLSIIAAALVSGAAYGQDYETRMRQLEANTDAAMQAWKESNERWRHDLEREGVELDAAAAESNREYQTELLEEMLDAIQDLDR